MTRRWWSPLLRVYVAWITCAAFAITAAVAHAASSVVQYTYDAAGNIVAIERANPAPISISGVIPTSGPEGTVVSIVGRGFSATAAGNAVSFNGVAAAAVTVKSTSLLTVVVPAGATTGKIAITVAGNTATSAQDFVVTIPGAPTVSGIAPMIAAAGTAVTVTGTNFDPAAGATTVKLNQTLAAASSVTKTQLTFAVPPATGSGRIRVTTSLGSAESLADFIVPPAGIAASDVIATSRLVADGAAKSISLLAANKYGLLLFDGNAGDWLSFQVANFAVNPSGATIAYTVYKPDNTKLASGILSAANLSIHVPALPLAGTYSVLLATGNAQVGCDVRLEANRFVPADGTTLAVTRGIGQTTRALIAAVIGEQKAVMVSEMNTVPATSLGYTIALPNGSTFRNGGAFGLGTTTQLPPFTVTGTHSVVFTPGTATTLHGFKVGLLAGVTLAVDSPAFNLAIANPGEGARLNFSATVGENFGIGITGLVLTPATTTAIAFSVYRPDGTLLTAGSCQMDGTQCSANLTNLPVTGSYSIIVQPMNGATGSMQVWLSHDVPGTLVIASPFNLAIVRAGQNARLTFPGTAGSLLTLQVRGVVTTPPNQGLAVVVYQSDGSLFSYTHLTGAGQTIVMPALPVAGTYVVFIEPEAAYQGAARASMEVLLDPGQNLAVDGSTQDATLGVAGGSVRYTFAGTAGQNLGLGVSNMTFTPAVDASVSAYRPDGTAWFAISCNKTVGGCGRELANLPSSGTYGIVVQPYVGAIGNFSITLTTDVVGSLVPAVPLPLTLARPGQKGRATFVGRAGDAVSLAFTQIATQPVNQFVYLTVLKPDGTEVAATATASASASIAINSLPVSGTYQVLIQPVHYYTANVTVTLTAP